MTEPIQPVVIFGEVLFDLFSEERCLGGAPFNFAFHLHRLGVPVAFISRVGEDALGKEVLAFAKQNEFPTKGIQRDVNKSTGEVTVSPNAFGGPRFEILVDRAYDFIDSDPFLESIKEPSWVYFGTLAQRNVISRKTIREYLKSRKGKTKVILDLNLRPPFFDYGIIDGSLGFCDLLKVNDQELAKIKTILGLEYYVGVNPLIEHLHREYGIYWICVTGGEKGCEWFEEGTPVPKKQEAGPVDTFENSVGAGDAFLAMLIFGLIQNWSITRILERSSLFASKVCTIRGALPVNREFYKTFISLDV